MLVEISHRSLEVWMNNFVPAHYHISLTPDLSRFRFLGRVDISGKLTQPADEIVLHSLELEIASSRALIKDHWESCTATLEPDREQVRIRLPETTSGDIRVRIEYSGSINDRMAGFYRSRYQVSGQDRYIAVTQFQESDARRAFPCQDHPQRKATFEVEMTVDRDLVAISNGNVIEEVRLEDEKKRIRFAQTPRMSTYLLFFGIGAFDVVQDPTDERVRAVTTPGMSPYVGFGLEFGRKALQFCEQYYRIPYPLPKMDLLAIPDFAFGAMENWGAITFRENLLLHYPDITSRAGEERICEVIAHEIAHQWFGNLVTPSDWKYLWLNESFATFFGYGVVDYHYPGWEIWQQFLGGQTESALTRDGMHETFAIEIPGGDHVIINSSTAPIIYSKGGSILRQVKGHIGDENFRNGLSRYLETHAYGNAASHHLWEALEAASEQPITKMMQSWIEQPGYPLVTVRREGGNLILNQRRFTYLPNSFDQQWDIPINIALFRTGGEMQVVQTLLTDKEQSVQLDQEPVAYKINAGQGGFYRTQYDDVDALASLSHYVENRKLPPEDRWGLQNDLYASVRGGHAGFDDYLELLASYRQEEAYLPIVSIARNLYQAYLLLDEDGRQKVSAAGKAILENALNRAGFEPQEQEPFTVSLMRDQIMLPSAVFGAERIATFARQKYDALTAGKETVHPDLHKAVLQVGAWSGASKELDWLLSRFRQSDSEHERLNILAAVGCFKGRAQTEDVLQFALEEVPDRNKFIPIVATAGNAHAVGFLWDWYQTHRKQLETFHPLLYERVIAAIFPMVAMEQAEEVRQFCDSYLQERPQVRDVLKLSLEKLEINLRFRKKHRASD
jgi:tricorn protease interacting factor F2/3